MLTIYTIGHSSHSIERFLALLQQHSIDVLVDTRSSPFSKFVPWFDREPLKKSLESEGRQYLFLGDVVGGRPANQNFYDEAGHVLYARVAASDDYLQGIARLERGAAQYRIALLCGEEDPAHCHRRLLVSRTLIERGAEILHIRGDGALQTEPELAQACGKPLTEPQRGLFAELDEVKWRSTASVSRKRQPANSSTR